MVTSLEEYRKVAEANDMCAEYVQKWDECLSNKQVMDMALGVKAIDFVCDSIAKGWGITSEAISERFGCFLNGRYTSAQKGYTSSVYCRYKGVVIADTTVFCLIDCDMDIDIPSIAICQIYVTGKSKIRVKGKGQATIICYGDNVDVELESARFKRINKKERDKNE